MDTPSRALYVGPMTIAVAINGDMQEFEAPLTVAELMQRLGLEPAKVAIERNLAIVPRSQHAHVLVDEGDRIEIVEFIGGG